MQIRLYSTNKPKKKKEGDVVKLLSESNKICFILRDLCVINGFGFFCNDMITTKYLWKDGIHLQDLGMSILSKKI